MSRDEWSQALFVTATIALVTAGLIWLLGPSRRGAEWDEPTDPKPRRTAPADVTLWVGEVQPGLKGALTSVYGDPGPDARHDERLNAGLGLTESAALGFYRLMLFNVSAEDKRFDLTDGALLVQVDGGAVGLRNLSARIDAGELVPAPALRFTLTSLGTLRKFVDVPAGKRANLVVAFDARPDLTTAHSVETSEGRSFHRLQRTRSQLRSLISDPSTDRIRDF